MTGIISRVDKSWIVVHTSDDLSLIIQTVENEKGQNIINKLNQGDRFYTDQDKLLLSKTYRAKYRPKIMD